VAAHALDRLTALVERFDMHDLVGSPIIVAQPLNSASWIPPTAATIDLRISGWITVCSRMERRAMN